MHSEYTSLAVHPIPMTSEIICFENPSVVDSSAVGQLPISAVSSMALKYICSPTCKISCICNDELTASLHKSIDDSFITEGSVSTLRKSNSTKRQSEKEERIFLNFVKILLKIVEAKDKEKFHNVKEVICACKQQKKRGEIDNFIKGLRSPLKDAVGPQYWREAQERLSRAISYSKIKISSFNGTTEEKITEIGRQSVETLPSILCYEEEGLSPSPCPTMVKSETAKKSNAAAINKKEMRTRKERLRIIITILMQHLQKTNPELYHKAHKLIEECTQRHRKGRRLDSQHRSLAQSIQFCLKNKIGAEYWRRAEAYVAKFLLKCHEKSQDAEIVGRIVIVEKR
mmetsp:Transcript_6698/g.15239  ORF Transcript_6698/g.15239 Transcript_6698/m.15239 type:complete len:342 (+) Transcript_6698:120-1145(+)